MHDAMYSKLQIKPSTSSQLPSLSELHRKSSVMVVVCGSAERSHAYLGEADVVCLLTEAATADKHAVLADQTCTEMVLIYRVAAQKRGRWYSPWRAEQTRL